MVKVFLDLKLEIPEIDTHIDNILNFELKKDLQGISNQLANKAAKIIEQHNRLKIYKEGA